MRNAFFVLLFLSLGSLIQAQKANGIIKGKVTDSTAKEALSDATVSILLLKDSSLVTYVLSGKHGDFEIKDLAAGSYAIFVSYEGLQTYVKDFTLTPQNNLVDIGIIKMEKDYRPLEGITVTSEPPISIRGDTVQFRASAFKTLPNSVAEDLLKKLPGVEVDKDGNVKVQGEDVKKIYVDGKEFFGNDPKMATKNITTDMIESVQVYDDMSEQAKFTKIDDGSRSKTINIKLKKDRRQAYFGRASAGGGNNGRYESSLFINRFNKERRISITGSSNNSNKQNFGIGNMGYMGEVYGGFGGGGGLTRSSAAGINYTDKFAGKIDVTGSYLYSTSDSRTQRTSFRETSFLHDSTTNQNSQNSSANKNRNQRFTLRAEYTIDTLNSIIFSTAVSLQNANSSGEDTSSTLAITPAMTYLANTTVSRYTNTNDGNNISYDLLFRHKFRKRGRTFSLGMNSYTNSGNGNGMNVSPIVFYNPDGTVERVRQQNFMSEQIGKSSNYSFTTSYTEPIGKNKVLELNYGYNNNHSISDRDAFDYNLNSKEFDIINKQQTNYSSSDYMVHRAGVNFRYHIKKVSVQAGGSLQNSNVSNESVRGIYNINGKDSTIITKQSYTNFFPTANFNYDISKSQKLYFNYRGRTSQPNISQLENVLDLTNPLQVRSGNPGLRQEFSHNMDLTYRISNIKNSRYLNINLSGGKTSNKIVNSIDSLPKGLVSGPDSSLRGVQFIRPVNLDGAFNGYLNTTVGIPFRKMKGSNVNFTNTISYSRNVSMLYKQRNFTNNLSISQSASINLDIRETINLGFRVSLSYSDVRYSFEASRNNNTTYFFQSYSTNISYYIAKIFLVSSNFDFTINTGRVAGYNQAIPLWNANVSKQLFKNKKGEVKFSVNDILNQNQSISRTQGENYFYDSRTVVLKRYFLLSFTYNLFKGTRDTNQRPIPFIPGGY